MSTNWKIDGTYFEACNCDVACPCVFLSPPTEGDCTALLCWHIDQGNFEEVSLDGLNTALAVHSPGNMVEGNWKVGLYLDDNATSDQNEALTKIFGGQAGGHFAVLGALISEVVGVSAAPIDYRADGNKRSVKVGDIARAEIDAIAGQGGAEVAITNHPLAVSPGYAAVASKSKELSYQDHGMNWEISGKNGFFAPFSYQGG
jgi:hypothetical protein